MTDLRYLKIHHRLRQVWLSDYYPYAYLTPTKQWQLHNYFLPYKDLTDAELLDHRQIISKERPSLPQQAGRAYREFEEIEGALVLKAKQAPTRPVKGKRRQRSKEYVIAVRGVVKPEPDIHQLARAIIEMAKEMQKEIDSKNKRSDELKN